MPTAATQTPLSQGTSLASLGRLGRAARSEPRAAPSTRPTPSEGKNRLFRR